MSQRAELIQTIQDIENGLAMNPTGEILERLTSRLARAKAKLDGLDEKKSESQPPANPGQLEQPERRLPTKEELQAWRRGMEKSAQNQHRDQAESANAFNCETTAKVEHLNQAHQNYIGTINRLVVGTITEAPVITVPVVEITLSSGAKKMNRVEIMNMLKTWFKRVATSRAMEKGLFSDAYGGAMGQDTYKLFQGWNTIYNETQEGAAWPPLEDVFPGLGRASQSQKVNAEILWRWASNDK